MQSKVTENAYPPQRLTRREIRAAFKRHRGEATKLAKDLNVHPVTISSAMRGTGQYSARIHEAIRVRAAELIASETRESAA